MRRGIQANGSERRRHAGAQRHADDDRDHGRISTHPASSHPPAARRHSTKAPSRQESAGTGQRGLPEGMSHDGHRLAPPSKWTLAMRPATQVMPSFESRYGGSVHTQSTLSSGIVSMSSRQSPRYSAEDSASVHRAPAWISNLVGEDPVNRLPTRETRRCVGGRPCRPARGARTLRH